MFDRPGVAGAVLQTPLLLIQSVSELSFSSKSSLYYKSQTVWARAQNFWENVHPHNMSHVTCQMPCITCQMSCVNCHIIFFVGLIGGAYRWRVCYQQGLPCLVLFNADPVIVFFFFAMLLLYLWFIFYLSVFFLSLLINTTGTGRPCTSRLCIHPRGCHARIAS